MLTLGRPLEPNSQEFGRLLQGIVERARWSNDGPLVRDLEQRTGEALDWPHVVAMSSGTSALTAALLALGLPRGAEVITTPLTFRATALAIEAAGLRPVFAAVDPDTLLLSVDAVEQAMSPRTGAILPVHLFGLAADPRFEDLAEARGLPVVYDAAHSFDVTQGIAGRGTATAYSLHATKLLHTGEGGLLCTEDEAVAERARTIRNFGLVGHAGTGPGMNAKLSEVSAAVGLAMFDRLEAEVARRTQVRAAYAAALGSSTRAHSHAPDHVRSVVMEVIRCDPGLQSQLVRELAERGIAARIFPALTSVGERFQGASIAGTTSAAIDELSRSVIALPIHGSVKGDHLEHIAEVLGT